MIPKQSNFCGRTVLLDFPVQKLVKMKQNIACSSLQQPELSFSTSDMFFCALEIGRNSVLQNIGGATAPPAPPASWALSKF